LSLASRLWRLAVAVAVTPPAGHSKRQRTAILEQVSHPRDLPESVPFASVVASYKWLHIIRRLQNVAQSIAFSPDCARHLRFSHPFGRTRPPRCVA